MDRLFPLIKGRLMEISIGDVYEEIVLSDHTKSINSTIYGTVQDLLGDFLILDCYFSNATGEVSSGNIVMLNTWNIKAMTEVNGSGSLNDVFMGTKDVRKIKRLQKSKQ